MKRKLGFVFAVLAFLTPFLIGIANVLLHAAETYAEYLINFTNGVIFGSIFEWVFSIISLIILIHNEKNTASKVVIVIDIIMLVAGIGCSLCMILVLCIR